MVSNSVVCSLALCFHRTLKFFMFKLCWFYFIKLDRFMFHFDTSNTLLVNNFKGLKVMQTLDGSRDVHGTEIWGEFISVLFRSWRFHMFFYVVASSSFCKYFRIAGNLRKQIQHVCVINVTAIYSPKSDGYVCSYGFSLHSAFVLTSNTSSLAEIFMCR